MKTLAMLCMTIGLLIGAAARAEDQFPEMPKPQKEHAWLEQFAGEWDYVMEAKPPGQKEAIKLEGHEKARMIGGFWLMAESKGQMFGTPFTGIMTLGYDKKQGKYIGTWVDSMGDYLWQYTGTVEGKKLTLESKGPCPFKPPGTLVNFRESFELKDQDHKVFTSSYQEDDGSWVQVLTTTYTRRK